LTQAADSPAAQTGRMFVEQRADPREPLALPLQLSGGQTAVTRDISASGMYLEVEGLHDIAGPVLFEMHVTDAGMKFTAEGRIVRVEHRHGRTGIALKLVTPRLELLE
jgi:hypothetical protein